MKTKYIARTADGREFTRTSARAYTHAVIVTFGNGNAFVSFSGSAELADKAAASVFSVAACYRGHPQAYAAEAERMAAKRAESTIEIVEVTA